MRGAIVFLIGLFALILTATAGERAVAQAVRQPLGATTLQLPTFNFFAISTSVEVPDSGEGFLGGVNSATSASSQSGLAGLGFVPFTDAAVAAGSHGGGVSVRATIHDFDAMDKALLGADFQNAVGAAAVGSQPPARVLATDSAGGSSLAEIRRQQAAEDAAAIVEAQRLFDAAAAYEKAGKPGLAKIDYRMAANRARGALKADALTALQRLNAASQAAAAIDR